MKIWLENDSSSWTARSRWLIHNYPTNYGNDDVYESIKGAFAAGPFWILEPTLLSRVKHYDMTNTLRRWRPVSCKLFFQNKRPAYVSSRKPPHFANDFYNVSFVNIVVCYYTTWLKFVVKSQKCLHIMYFFQSIYLTTFFPCDRFTGEGKKWFSNVLTRHKITEKITFCQFLLFFVVKTNNERNLINAGVLLCIWRQEGASQKNGRKRQYVCKDSTVWRPTISFVNSIWLFLQWENIISCYLEFWLLWSSWLDKNNARKQRYLKVFVDLHHKCVQKQLSFQIPSQQTWGRSKWTRSSSLVKGWHKWSIVWWALHCEF